MPRARGGQCRKQITPPPGLLCGTAAPRSTRGLGWVGNAPRPPARLSPAVSCSPCPLPPQCPLRATLAPRLGPRPSLGPSGTVTFRASKPGCTGTSSAACWAPARPRPRVSSRSRPVPGAQREGRLGAQRPFLTRVQLPRGCMAAQVAPTAPSGQPACPGGILAGVTRPACVPSMCRRHWED